MLTMADIAPESVLLGGAGRAILLQIAHPAIGYGVARHSDFANRPMDRLNGTLSYIYALSTGSEADIRAVRRAVNRAHAPVRNPPPPPATPPSTANPTPQVTTGDAMPQVATGGAEPQVATGEAEPRVGTGDAEPRVATGDAMPRVASEDVEPLVAVAGATVPMGSADATASVPIVGGTSPVGSAGGEGGSKEVDAERGAAGAGRAGVGGAGGGDPAYDARDPGLQLWVAATLYDTAVTVYELVYGPLDEESADHVYREYALLGTALQMPEELWPADRAAFRRYFDRTVQTLTVDDTVRGVADALLAAEKAPLPIRLGMPLARFATVALLPERLRSEFGYTWSAGSERRFRRLLRVVAPVYRVLPARIRQAPQRHYLAKLRAASDAPARPRPA
ncbi:oxygenase MpaB family protein [Herbiconiux sp. P15]|uniref:oxygenase MpaB family protein n=1 Tax=Herbiconiux liukaitaii TaxID=3342799 RepID=UPI0035B6FD4B